MEKKSVLFIFLVFLFGFAIFLSHSVFAVRSTGQKPGARISRKLYESYPIRRIQKKLLRLRQVRLNDIRQKEETEGAAFMPEHPFYNHELTGENLISTFRKSQRSADLLDMKDFFPRYTSNEIQALVEKLVEKKQLVPINVRLSDAETFEMFIASETFNAQRLLVVEYIMVSESFSIDSISKKFPLFIDYWVINTIVSELAAQQAIVPNPAGSDWKWTPVVMSLGPNPFGLTHNFYE